MRVRQREVKLYNFNLVCCSARLYSWQVASGKPLLRSPVLGNDLQCPRSYRCERSSSATRPCQVTECLLLVFLHTVCQITMLSDGSYPHIWWGTSHKPFLDETTQRAIASRSTGGSEMDSLHKLRIGQNPLFVFTNYMIRVGTMSDCGNAQP